jgi:hypothetical protein
MPFFRPYPPLNEIRVNRCVLEKKRIFDVFRMVTVRLRLNPPGKPLLHFFGRRKKMRGEEERKKAVGKRRHERKNQAPLAS